MDEEVSIGDYVLTGGELPALVLVDTIARMVPGVLPENLCFEEESHFGGLLEYPQYTRPAVWHDREVPPVLLTGHHKNIAEWRSAQSLEETKTSAPTFMQAIWIKITVFFVEFEQNMQLRKKGKIPF